jgi:hypothetical protein
MTARLAPRLAVLLLPATLCLPRHAAAQTSTFDVTAYGAYPDDSIDDGPAIRSAIADAAAAGGGTVLFHQGVYLVGSLAGAGLTFDDVHNVWLQALGGHSPTLAFVDRSAHGIVIRGCTNLRFVDLVLTWRDPCHFEGTLVSAQPAGNDTEYVLDCPGVNTTDPFLFAANASWQLHFFHPETRTRRAFSAKLKGVLASVNGTQLTVKMPEWATADPDANGTELLDAVAITVESNAGNAIWSMDSNDLWFERVQIERAPFFGAQHNGDGAVTYVECTIGAGPGLDAPPLVSTNRDGLRFRSQRGKPKVQNCRIERTGDDAINVFSPWMVAVPSGQNTQLWDAGDPNLQVPGSAPSWSLSLRRNDRLLIHDAQSLQLLGNATITSVTPTHIVTTTGMALPTNALIMNATAHARDTVVQDNFIRDVEARAMLVRSTGGTITGNRIVGTPKGAIQLTADTQYYKEGGFSRAVEVSGNTIHVAGFERWNSGHPGNCHLGAVTVGVDHTQSSWPAGYGHAEILIADNWIVATPLVGAFVASTHTVGTDPRLPPPVFGARVDDNWVLASQIQPSTAGSARGIAGATGGVHLLHVDETTVIDNVIHSQQPGPLVTKVDYGANTTVTGTQRAYATSFEVEEEWLWGGLRLQPFAGRKLAGTPTLATVDGNTLEFHDWHLQGRDAALDFARGYVCSVCPANGGHLRVDVPSNLQTSTAVLTFWATSRVVSNAAPQPLDIEVWSPGGLTVVQIPATDLAVAPNWSSHEVPLSYSNLLPTAVTLRRAASNAEVFVDDLVISQ